MSQSTHRFVLEMDAQQAKRVAKEFRQAMEAELGGIGSGTGSSPLANVQKSVEQISKTEMFTDATRRAEQLENVMRRIRDLSTQVQNMDVRFEPNTARWNAQVDEFYRKVESAMGKQQADLARGRNVIPNVGAVSQEFASDTIPVEEWSVKAKRTAEEVRRMDNEYNKLFAELSQAQAERISIERQGIEEEIQSIEKYISSTGNADEALLNQLQELSDTKDRMVREEAQELASYQRAMQEYIANDVKNVPQDGPAATSRLTISNQTVANMERLAELLQQAEGYQKSIAASTQAQSQSISQELAERRQLLEAEYQGKLRLLESDRQTLKVSSDITQEEADKENARKIGLNTSKQALVVAQQDLETAKSTVKEIERKAEAEKRARAEANRDYAKANTETAKVNAGRDEAIIVQKGLDALKAEQQAIKQTERNNLESEKRKTEDKRVESAKRVEEERRATAEIKSDKQKEVISHREAQERMTAITKEESRRQTRLYEQELRERNRQAQKSQTQISGFLRNTAQDLVYGGLGLYGADQVVQRLYDFGKQGAQQLRTIETFNNLAQLVGTNADSMLAAIQGASQGTVSEFNAMSYASQVFSLKFAKDVENIDGDMEVIIRGARRFSQIFTDEFGKALSIEEIFSRLLKYVREGNKELVDQFGITNQGIADALGVPNEGLRDAEGAVLRWQGLVKVIEEQLGRLGEATNSEADRFERSEARISDAINRLRQASAEPIAVTVEMAADIVDVATRNTTTAAYNDSLDKQLSDLEKLRKQMLAIGAAQEGDGFQGGAFLIGDKLNDQIGKVEEFKKKIEDLSKIKLDEVYNDVNFGRLGIEEGRQQLSEFSDIASRVSEEFSRASLLAQSGVLNESAYNVASSELQDILVSLQNGNIEYETAKFKIDAINQGLLGASSVFSFMIPQAWEFATALAAGADAWAAGEQARVMAFDENPDLAMNDITKQSGVIAYQSQKRLQQIKEEAQARTSVEQATLQYDLSRMSPAEQLSYYQGQRQSAVAAGKPESVIMGLDLEIKKLTDVIMDQNAATQKQIDANYEYIQKDFQSPENRLADIRNKLQYDNLTDLEVSELQREAYDLGKVVAQNQAEAFLDGTRQAIEGNASITGRLDIAQTALNQSIGTQAEEGARELYMDVLRQQQDISDLQWQSAYNAADTLTKMEMTMTKFEQATDPTDAQSLKNQYADLQNQLAEERKRRDLGGLDDAGQIGYLKDYLTTLNEGTQEYQDTLDEITNLERRLAKETADEAQAAWEKAANDMAKSFEEELAKVMNIPGVLSPSSVTEQDMIDTKYGLYKDNADEWLRRAKDELINGVDRPDVDPGKIAEMLGLPGGLPGEVLYGRLEGAWANQSLFANPDNLSLLNTDAIMSRYEDIKKGEIGRQNLEDYISQTLQISASEASQIAGTQSPLIQQLTGGQSGAEMAAQISSIQNEVLGNLDSSFVDTIASGWQRDIDQNIAKLDPLADAMADRINGRLTEKLGELTGLVDSVVTRVLELLGDEEEA